MLRIDGSMGEGGGQILRSSLGLSLLTRTPFIIENIRARRAKPGLMRQHLTAVKAATEVGSARVTGDELGSQRLEFHPGEAAAGRYHFKIGTAGSAALVLQTVLPALLFAEEPSELILEGGTHNPMAPPFEFLQHAFLPLLRQMGAQLDLELERHGFYPAGGGQIRTRIHPVENLLPLHLPERQDSVSLTTHSWVSQLPYHITTRQMDQVGKRLDIAPDRRRPHVIKKALGPGNVLQVHIEGASVTEVFTTYGRKGKRSEYLAEELSSEVRDFLDCDVCVGPHLADQLLLPIALAGSGSFFTVKPTDHTITNAEVIRLFCGKRFVFERTRAGVYRVGLDEA
ncbi:RNA 3'-terminal phosphate cyclase [Sulfidibacter corallicola]|uniref:RNA 3'-terminal phosphate cyclase n=1 Tax=Sulfidibacter corallicola TaxID=2818388 RepID=A0A8A4U4R7_SULCO|nr:RNA 3'-terminal phosphate cyclase [Sulfidibacter corallicola]QTD53745.1 RNA 3'-terminal phosphate cyclase [Sulfidibacter corallicola]